MRRRILLRSVGSCCVALSGCLSNGDEDEENMGNEDYDWEERHENDGDEDDWSKEFHSGRPLVEVTVDEAFDGDVVFKANCRDKEYRIPAGEELSINREEDGESCSFRLLLDNKLFDGGVSGSAIAYIEVTGKGEVLASEDAI